MKRDWNVKAQCWASAADLSGVLETLHLIRSKEDLLEQRFHLGTVVNELARVLSDIKMTYDELKIEILARQDPVHTKLVEETLEVIEVKKKYRNKKKKK